MAKNPRVQYNDYTRTSIDEARSVVQAELQNLIEKPSRFSFKTSGIVDLDFKIEGPALYTHLDVEDPLGSYTLKKQKQRINIEQMAFRIGQKL